MSENRYGLDFKVYGSDPVKPVTETPTPLQGINHGWNSTSNNSTGDVTQMENESQLSENSTTSSPKNSQNSCVLKNARFLPQKTIDFNQPCPVIVDIETTTPLKTQVMFSLWAKYKGKEYDLEHQKKVDPVNDSTSAKTELKLFYVEDYDFNTNDGVDYFFKVTTSNAKEIVSDIITLPYIEKIQCNFLKIINFHHNCALPCIDEKGELIETLASAFSFYKNNPTQELIIAGHCDTDGKPEGNFKLSQRRAEAVKALLENDITLWNNVVNCNDHILETEDYQQTLKGLSVYYSWPCDPGEIDNLNGPETTEAVKSFQSEYNIRMNGNLKVDGVVGSKTWEAIGKTMVSLLADNLKNIQKLDPIPVIKYGYPDGAGVYPCGENCPVENPEDPDFKSEKNRRVELVFYSAGDSQPATKPVADEKISSSKDPVSRKECQKKAIPVKAAPAPVKKSIQIKGKIYWNRTWDYMDETTPIAAIKEYLPGAKVELEIQTSPSAAYKKHSETYLSDNVTQPLIIPHVDTGEFIFSNVSNCNALRLRILLEYNSGKIVCVKGKTIKGNSKYKNESDFKIHTGKTVEHTLVIPMDKIKWDQDVNDIGDTEITKALFIDICDAYKSVWLGFKRLKELAEYEADICQINFPEDPSITVSNAGMQMQLCKDDLKDRAVILHEYSHFIGRKIFGTANHPGYKYNDDATNSHGPKTKEHYEVAWNEGYSTFLSCAMTDNPHYHDGYDTSFNMHLDTDNTTIGPHCEGSVQEALWRIHKIHNLDFKTGFWKAFSDKSIRTCSTIFDFFNNWKDLNLNSIDKVKEAFKQFNMENGYKYLAGTDRFKNVTAPDVYDELKKEFATLVELHTHKGSIGGGSTSDYNEEFYNRNKFFNSGSLDPKSSIATPKVKVGTLYIIPERFTI